MATSSGDGGPIETVPSRPAAPKRRVLLDYLGLLFGLTTVVGFVLAYYWHAQSVQERAPRYYVAPDRTRIVDNSIPAPPQLQVLYKGNSLSTNVSALALYFWNDGKLSIKAADVLEPLRVELDPSCEIIDARIVKVSRSVTKFAGEISGARNSLLLSFNILEQGDGALLQIIYIGKPDTAVRVAGTIEGAGTPQRLTANQSKQKDRRQLKAAVYIGWFSVPLMTALFVGLALLGPNRHVPFLSKRFVLVTVVACIPFVILAAFTTYQFYSSEPSVPPSIWAE
jgi:hypothetical protein